MTRRAANSIPFSWIVCILVLSGCVTSPAPTEPAALADFSANNDPFEPTNRVIYRLNEGIDTAVLKPVAQAYRYVVPALVRRSLDHALYNVASPVAFANDVLQGHPRYAAETVTRFVVNSTAGVGGLFDVADSLGLPPHRGAGFGTTLAVWGVANGPYLILPLLGPSTVRDAGGLAGDVLADPFTWVTFGGVNTLQGTRVGTGVVNRRETLLDPIDELKRKSLDPYGSLRSVYYQQRAATIEKARHEGGPLPPP